MRIPFSLSRFIIYATSTVLLAGCASWFSSKSGPEPTPLQAITPSANLKILWQGRSSDLQNAIMSPAVVGDRVYAAGHDGTVVAYQNGKELWRKSVGAPLSSGVGANENTVVVGSFKGEVIALNAQTGAVLWQKPSNGEPHNTPLIIDNIAVVRVGDAKLAAYNLADGSSKWVYRRDAGTLSVRTYAGLLPLADLIFAGFQNGKLIAVKRDDGAGVWEGNVAIPRGSNEIERIADIVGNPVAVPTGVCAGAFQGRVACFNSSNGAALWTRDFSTPHGVAADDQRLYFADEKSVVQALDLATGASAWKQSQLTYRNLSAPLVVGNYIIVADSQGWVHALDRADGHIVARIQVGSSGVAGPLIPISNGFILQNQNGGIAYLSVAAN